MPRGKKSAKKEVEEKPKANKRAPRTKSKKMEKGESKVTVGRKRKQKAPEETPQQEENNAPIPKRPKASSRHTEETDRAVFTTKAPTAEKEAANDESKADRISHHSHKHTPGEVMTFGQGDVGQLGLGEEMMERSKPFPVRGDLEGKKIVQVVCGGMHTVALTEDGKVYTWGCNDEGSLGRPADDGEEYSAGVVESLEGVVQVSAGDSHTAALTDTGSVYCWGVFRDSNGPFGLTRPGLASRTPEVVYVSEQNKAIKVVSGSDHVIVLTVNGDIFSFGCAEQGQLGRVPECFSVRGGRKGVQHLLEPQVIRFRRGRGLSKPKFSDVFCGLYQTFAVAENSSVYGWGLNNYGQLGVDDDESRFQPEQLDDGWLEKNEDVDSEKISASDDLEISGGLHHTLICHRGSVYVMGRREYGRLGLGEDNTEEPDTPLRIPKLTNIVGVSAGSVCSFATSKSGQVYSWGMGTNLQLGNGSEDDVWVPTIVTGKKIENRKIVSSSSGGQHSAVLVSLPYDS